MPSLQHAPSVCTVFERSFDRHACASNTRSDPRCHLFSILPTARTGHYVVRRYSKPTDGTVITRHDIVGRTAAMIAIGGTADAGDHGGGAENGADDPERSWCQRATAIAHGQNHRVTVAPWCGIGVPCVTCLGATVTARAKSPVPAVRGTTTPSPPSAAKVMDSYTMRLPIRACMRHDHSMDGSQASGAG